VLTLFCHGPPHTYWHTNQDSCDPPEPQAAHNTGCTFANGGVMSNILSHGRLLYTPSATCYGDWVSDAKLCCCVGFCWRRKGMGIGEEGMAAWGGPILVYRILWTRIWRAIYSGLECGALTIGLSVRRAAQLIKTIPVINVRVTIKRPFPVCWPATHVLAST